ncbi:hypothetical protein HAX54_040975, partial [Datura stramonium]|nr:hypothetical protein [Datura stramonium]
TMVIAAVSAIHFFILLTQQVLPSYCSSTVRPSFEEMIVGTSNNFVKKPKNLQKKRPAVDASESKTLTVVAVAMTCERGFRVSLCQRPLQLLLITKQPSVEREFPHRAPTGGLFIEY